jgi:hypothetical protein
LQLAGKHCAFHDTLSHGIFSAIADEAMIAGIAAGVRFAYEFEFYQQVMPVSGTKRTSQSLRAVTCSRS